jgi:ATP-dependent Clp protease ATP-binding subunit ClpA
MLDELDLLRYTMDGRRVIFAARQAMDQVGGREMGPEHLVLGLLDESVGAARRLASVTVPEEELRETLLRPLRSPERPQAVSAPVSSAVRAILRSACEEASQMGHQRVSSEHILLGVLLEDTTEIAKYLIRHGQDVEELRQSLRGREPMEDDE